MATAFLIASRFKLALGLVAVGLPACCVQSQTSLAPTPESGIVQIIGIKGVVEVSRAKSGIWDKAYTNQFLFRGDRLRTLERSWALVQVPTRSPLQIGELSLLEVLPEKRRGLGLLRGLLYFFHRDEPDTIEVQTPSTAALIRGTEFNLKVDDRGATTLSLFEGQVELTNAFGHVTLASGEQGTVEPGQSPRKTAVLFGVSIIQWALYYPAILNLDELTLSTEEQQALADSLAAYRSGDLLQAMSRYPAGRQPASPSERLYLAALLLSVGLVEEASALLDQLPTLSEPPTSFVVLAAGIRELVTTVQRQPAPSPPSQETTLFLQSSTALLAHSYHLQAQTKLKEALESARRCVTVSSNFSFGWARVAELEFSFGRASAARAAVEKSLSLAPRNAQALALKGFLLAAENKIADAVLWFNRALAIDNALGNAWLGRGLCQIRKGQVNAGADDLRNAAALEPNRSLLRSYLGKGWSEMGMDELAAKELTLAKELDPADPTPALYSALLHQSVNRINTAVEELDRSLEQNDNRQLYRSRLLLDEDRAVRGANLSSVYRDAGMLDLSHREAARAVNVDYANYSAHLFLANSYYDLLNFSPQVNLRYETPRVSEYLVSTLLAPPGAGVFSPTVSQQEYSRLFERDRFGITSSTEYLSRGAWTESAAQFGIFGNLSYSLDVYYQTDPGQRPNNDLELTSLSPTLKYQVTPRDGVFFQLIDSHARFGDLAHYYNPFDPTNGANRFVHGKETQEPILLGGYHHEWSPRNHTMVLAGRLDDTLEFDNPAHGDLLFARNVAGGPVQAVLPFGTQQDYRSELEIYTAEAQQIIQSERLTLILGARYQAGTIATRNTNTLSVFDSDLGTILPGFFDVARQDFESSVDRINGYSYAHWQVAEPLRLLGGVAYDRLTYPVNFRYAPVSEQHDTTDQVSPKAGVILTPLKDTVVRAAYSKALGGISIDQSFQLEPSQVAGFNQSWRSMMPESVTGANAAERFESWGASLEQKFRTQTYVALAGEWLRSKVNRSIGIFDADLGLPAPPFIGPSETREHLRFEERSLAVTINQLVAREWAFGIRYRLSQAELQDSYPEIRSTAQLFGGFRREQQLEALLHELDLVAVYNHASGFFGQVDAIWNAQDNDGYSPALPGDDFWQFNVQVGYRFLRRRIEACVGLLNITDQNYRLNPLNLVSELPRERTLMVSLRFSF